MVHVWKCSNVFPIYKKSEETDKTYYRPVSLLTALSKVFERAMFDRMYEAFRCKLSHNNYLSGYLRGHSCYSALLEMTEGWRASLMTGENYVSSIWTLSQGAARSCIDCKNLAIKASFQ